MSNKRKLKKATNKSTYVSVLNPQAAGIDIGSKSHFVCVPAASCEDNVREYPSYTADIHAMAAWLKECHVNTVAMESTGVYWIPVFEILQEYGFEVYLVNAKHVKNVPGRKTDVVDCQWIQQLHSYGLLSASFRPDETITELRSYTRQRERLIQSASRTVLHMQKALTQMNLQLTNVIDNIVGVTGMKIIRAIVSGERTPAMLASYRDRRCGKSEEEIAKSLHGNYQPSHIFALTQALELYDFYQLKIKECDKKIKKC